MSEGHLQPESAVTLAHALSASIATEGRLRALLLKGPAAAQHGIRVGHTSADADMLTSPLESGALLGALYRCGWRPRDGAPMGVEPVHSVTLIHEAWPCDIDVHVEFPGFLAPVEEVFDELWHRRGQIMLAGVQADMVDRSSAILIAALHALRTPVQTPRHAEEYQYLVTNVVPALSASERADLVNLARKTGCVDTARPLLKRLGLELPPPVPHGVDPALDSWRARTGGRAEPLAQWMPVIGDLPWRKKPAAIARMVWPTEEQFRFDHPETPDGRLAATRGRWARIGRGFRAVPTVIKGRMLARRGITDDSSLRQPRNKNKR